MELGPLYLLDKFSVLEVSFQLILVRKLILLLYPSLSNVIQLVYLTNANITVDTLTANQMNQYINSIYRMYINGNFVLSSNKIELGSSILYVSGWYILLID